MNYPYEVFLGLRYLRSKRKRGAISVLTWLSVVCVAIGVMALIVVLSVMNGFQEELKSRIIGSNPHIYVTAFEDKNLGNPGEVARIIRGLDHVVHASPYVQGQVLLRSGRDKVYGVMVWGIDPDDPKAVIDLDKYLWNAKATALNPPGTTGAGRVERIFLGAPLANRLQASEGSDVVLFLPIFHQTPMGMMPRSLKVQVAGLFSTEHYEYDHHFTYLPLSVAQKIYGMGDSATGIAVKVDEVGRSPEVAKVIRAKLNGEYYVRDWLQMNRNFLAAFQMEKVVMGVILSLIILVAAISIVSSLVMMVIEKTKEIGILKAMGATDGSVSRIFIIEGMVVALIGTLTGVALGFGICEAIEIFHIPMPGGGSVYILDRLPVKVEPLVSYGVIPVVSLALCFLATLYPARQAAKLEPVDAIRFG